LRSSDRSLVRFHHQVSEIGESLVMKVAGYAAAFPLGLIREIEPGGRQLTVSFPHSPVLESGPYQTYYRERQQDARSRGCTREPRLSDRKHDLQWIGGIKVAVECRRLDHVFTRLEFCWVILGVLRKLLIDDIALRVFQNKCVLKLLGKST